MLDRVKITNGMHSSSTFQSDTTNTNKTTNNNNTETTLSTIDNNDDIDITRLLNILNWSPLEDLVTPTTTTTVGVIPPSNNEENESKSKNGYNAVQISIELQKKMLR